MKNEILKEILTDTASSPLAVHISIGVKLIISFIEGLILGAERQHRKQTIGLRTVILISVSSTLLMIVSIYVGEKYSGDSARIAAQVVSGIGFLGGGAIMKQGMNIRGLTSAATIWGSAAIGLAVGAGLYIPSFITLLLFIFSLIVLDKIESHFFPTGKTRTLSIIFKNDNLDFQKLHDTIELHGVNILSTDIDQQLEEGRLKLKFSVRSPEEIDMISLRNDILQFGTLEEINLSI